MAKPTEELLQELTELTAIQGKSPSEIKRIHTIRVCLNRRGVKIPSKSQLINRQSESKYDLFVDIDGRGFKLVHANMSNASVLRRISIFKQMGIEYKVKESVTND